MSDAGLQRLAALQDGLVHALDAGDVDRIEAAIEALAAAVDEVRAGKFRGVTRDHAHAALAGNHAAQVRVNFLTDGIRRRLAALSALRGVQPESTTYRPIGG